ncbi:hypothetical protein [Bacillus pumilus]|uniref:hypothetical protein n=1 Tax=Bacillus pumilus TaxID=1408 RepID=UPI002FFF645A
MKKRVLFIILLSLSLILTSVPPSFATEKNTSKENDSFKNHEEFTEEIDGLKTNIKTMENDSQHVTTFKTELGTITYTSNKETGNISVSSNYLKSDEIAAIEEQVNKIANSIVLENQMNPTVTNSIEQLANDDFITQKQKGKWAWSKYDHYRITVEGKAALGVIVAAILNRIPYVGWIATAAAQIMIQLKMKTGYFSARWGTRADTDICYLWRKRHLKMFSDSKRKNKKLDEVGSAGKVYMCGTG